MYHENRVIELFVGYSFFDKTKQEMKANCSVTLVKSENKTVLVSFRIFLTVIKFLNLALLV